MAQRFPVDICLDLTRARMIADDNEWDGYGFVRDDWYELVGDDCKLVEGGFDDFEPGGSGLL